MATIRRACEISGSQVQLDQGAGQMTTATLPSIGGSLYYVMTDFGSDVGLYVRIRVPKNYVSAPKLVIHGVLDGAPGASDVLAFGFRKRATANNEAADGTYDAEQLASETIGSGGTNHSNEDRYEKTLDLTAADYAVDDEVNGWLYIDSNVNTYAGNLLLSGVEFQYDDT